MPNDLSPNAALGNLENHLLKLSADLNNKNERQVVLDLYERLSTAKLEMEDVFELNHEEEKGEPQPESRDPYFALSLKLDTSLKKGLELYGEAIQLNQKQRSILREENSPSGRFFSSASQPTKTALAINKALAQTKNEFEKALDPDNNALQENFEHDLVEDDLVEVILTPT